MAKHVAQGMFRQEFSRRSASVEDNHFIVNKRLCIPFAVLFVAFVVVVAVITSPPKEPEYQGKRLSEWRWDLGLRISSATNNFDCPTWEKLARAEEAVWIMGTNTIPFLIASIKRPYPSWMEGLRRRLKEASAANLIRFLPQDRTDGISEAFRVIGPKAKPWLAELEEIATNSPPEIAVSALRAISGISCEESAAILVRAMASTNIEIQGVATAVIGELGPHEEVATTRLIELSRATNGRVQAPAIWSLGKLPNTSNGVIPALIARLNDSGAGTKALAIMSLAHFGKDAAAATARIKELVDSPEPYVPKSAREALSKLRCEIRDGAVVRGSVDKKSIALVFAGHEFTEGGTHILNTLAHHSCKASFFLTGDFLSRPDNGELIRRIVREEHLLGPHSDKYLLYCNQDSPRKTLVQRHEFRRDVLDNIRRISPGELNEPCFGTKPSRSTGTSYFLPPHECYNQDIAYWTSELGRTLINPTPGTQSSTDCAGEADINFVSSQAIFDSIVQKEREDPHGLNGFILLFHLGSGPGRTDKFHNRFGELLDYLSGKGYQFVRVDELLEPKPTP